MQARPNLDESMALLNSDDVHDRVSALLAASYHDQADITDMMSKVVSHDPSDYAACFAAVLLKTRGRRGVAALHALVSTPLGVDRLYTVIVVLSAARYCGAAPEVRLLLANPSWYVRFAAVDYLLKCQRDGREFWPILSELEDELASNSESFIRTERFVPDPIFRNPEKALAGLKALQKSSRRWRRRRCD